MLIEEKELAIANLLVAAILTGLIWTIQVVHYPSFKYVEASQFIEFQHRHMRNISYVVIPLMLLEVFLAIWLQMNLGGKISTAGGVSANILLLIIWIATFAVSSSIHSQLATNGLDYKLITRLVNTNWIRTIAWTLRTGILTFIVLNLWK